MFATAILSQVLLAASALAIPSSYERYSRRIERRDLGVHLSRPSFRHDLQPLSAHESKGPTDNANVQYSGNWAGAVLVADNATYTAVTATFTVPKPSGSSGASASAWVGIDGDTCSTAILQTGVDFNVKDGSPTYDAWYEWYPDYAYDFSGIDFSAGDSVTVTVTASSLTSGTAIIENTTTGKKVSHTFKNQTQPLCETNAEWIVEDFESNGSQVDFANFDTVKFADAKATLIDGSTVGPTGADILDIKMNNTIYTDCSADDSSVTCSYIKST
ncbi:hypothetical protein PENSPDRAFT_162832 [Peniophora sp. CONT]|nr:hypothetical protein PENSPDRAFT_162832 [Peniophora sp. CONT]